MGDKCDDCVENNALIYDIINLINNSDTPLTMYTYKPNLLENIQELVTQYQELNNTMEELKITLDNILP